MVLAINKQFPGPTIIVNEGQIVFDNLRSIYFESSSSFAKWSAAGIILLNLVALMH